MRSDTSTDVPARAETDVAEIRLSMMVNEVGGYAAGGDMLVPCLLLVIMVVWTCTWSQCFVWDLGENQQHWSMSVVVLRGLVRVRWNDDFCHQQSRNAINDGNQQSSGHRKEPSNLVEIVEIVDNPDVELEVSGRP